MGKKSVKVGVKAPFFQARWWCVVNTGGGGRMGQDHEQKEHGGKMMRGKVRVKNND